MKLVERIVDGGLVKGPRVHLGMHCGQCGIWIGRSRGNLRERKSWVNAVSAMVARHDRLHHGDPSAR